MNVNFPLNDVGGGRIVQSSAAEGGRGNAPPGTINSPGLQFTLTNILFYISAPPSLFLVPKKSKILNIGYVLA